MIQLPVINRASLWYLIVVLTAVSFTWSERLSSIGVILLVAHWLFDSHLLIKLSSCWSRLTTSRLLPITLLLWSFFLLHVLGLLWSQHIAEGWQSIEVKLTLLILPVLFATENYLDAKKTATIFLIFSLSCCLSFFYSVAYSYLHYHAKGWSAVTQRMNISEGIMHPGYYSNYFAFALVWCVFELTSMKKNTTRRQAMLMGLILMLLSALLLLISKTAILYIACFAVYMVWMSTARIRQMAMRVLLFVVCIGSIGLITTQIPNIRNRIIETFRDSSQLNKDVPLANSTGSRLAAWHNEWTLIKENWLTGYGTGEANMALKHKLINDGYVRLAEENMHTHNQVFHTWLDLGIVGVLLMVAILLVSSQVFSRLHNRLAWWLLPLIVMNILTDDMLEVQAGTVFFAFFLTLFIYQRNNERLSYS